MSKICWQINCQYYYYKERLTSQLSYRKCFLRDSQVDFPTGNVFCTLGRGGGELHKNISQILAIIDFFKERNYWENLVNKEEYYRQHNFSLSARKKFKGGALFKNSGPAPVKKGGQLFLKDDKYYTVVVAMIHWLVPGS